MLIRDFRFSFQILALSLMGSIYFVSCSSPANHLLTQNLNGSAPALTPPNQTEFNEKIKAFLADPDAQEFNFENANPSLLIQKKAETANKVAELRRSGQGIAIQGEVQLPDSNFPALSLFQPVPNQNIVVYSPDGLTLAVTQTDEFGQYRIEDLPIGMRLELVAHSSDGDSVARALVDIPLNEKRESIEQNLNPRTSLVAESVWLAQKDGNAALEQISISQMESLLGKSQKDLQIVQDLQSLVNLSHEMAQEFESSVPSGFATQSVFKRKAGCSLRILNKKTAPFKVTQINTGVNTPSLNKIDKLQGLIVSVADAYPNLKPLSQQLQNNTKQPAELWDLLDKITQEASKAAQVAIAKNSMILLENVGTNLKADLPGNVGSVGTPQCTQFSQTTSLVNPLSNPVAPTPSPPTPPVIKLNRTQAPSGFLIEISGSDIPNNLATTRINFGDTTAKITGLNLKLDAQGKEYTVLKIKVPELKSRTSHSVTLVADGLSSNKVNFFVKDGISSVSHLQAAPGTQIKVKGDFDPNSKLVLVSTPASGSPEKTYPVRLESTTNDTLTFLTPELPEGNYTLRLETDQIFGERIKILAAAPKILDISPNPASLSEKITVKISKLKYNDILALLNKSTGYVDELTFDRNEVITKREKRDFDGYSLAQFDLVFGNKRLYAGINSLQCKYKHTDKSERYTDNFDFVVAPSIEKIALNIDKTTLSDIDKIALDEQTLRQAKPGKKIEIEGVFAEKLTENIVKFGNTTAEVVDSGYRQTGEGVIQLWRRYLVVKVPEINGESKITVTVNGVSSKPVNFTVLEKNTKPEITKLVYWDTKNRSVTAAVTQVKIDEQIMIEAKKLDAGRYQVKIGQEIVKEFISRGGSESISLKIPPLKGKQNVTLVSEEGVSSNAVGFDVTLVNTGKVDSSQQKAGVAQLRTGEKLILNQTQNLPPIESVTPLLKIGKEYGRCDFNKIKNQLTCALPANTGAGLYQAEIALSAVLFGLDGKKEFIGVVSDPISIEIPFGMSKSTYTVSGDGTYVYLDGTGFSSDSLKNQVTIGGQSAKVLSAKSNLLTVALPKNIFGAADVVVKTDTKESKAKILLPPVISSVSIKEIPQKIFANTYKNDFLVILKGEGFHSDSAKNKIDISGVDDLFTSNLTTVKASSASKTELRFNFPNKDSLGSFWKHKQLLVSITPEGFGSQHFFLDNCNYRHAKCKN